MQTLTPFQRESIDLFVGAFAVLSLPRSLGEIYGLLYSTEEPLAFDDLVTRLELSKGSVSEGLRLLRSLGAVNLVPIEGSRKDHFTAETSLRKLAGGYLRDRIEPYLRGGETRIESLRKVSATDAERNDFQQKRINQLLSWHRFFARVLPVFKALAGKLSDVSLWSYADHAGRMEPQGISWECLLPSDDTGSLLRDKWPSLEPCQ